MSTPAKRGVQERRKSRSLLEVLTGRVAKITALVTTLAALAAGLVKLAEVTGLFPVPAPKPAPVASAPATAQARPVASHGPALPDPNCLKVDEPRFPERLVYANGEWAQDPRIKLSGTNDCSAHVGLFLIVTSTRSGLFDLQPWGVAEFCEKPSLNKKDCWEFKIPVGTEKHWTWEARFPYGKPNNDQRLEGTISVNYEVRRIDLPETILRGAAAPPIKVVLGG